MIATSKGLLGGGAAPHSSPRPEKFGTEVRGDLRWQKARTKQAFLPGFLIYFILLYIYFFNLTFIFHNYKLTQLIHSVYLLISYFTLNFIVTFKKIFRKYPRTMFYVYINVIQTSYVLEPISLEFDCQLAHSLDDRQSYFNTRHVSNLF